MNDREHTVDTLTDALEALVRASRPHLSDEQEEVYATLSDRGSSAIELVDFDDLTPVVSGWIDELIDDLKSAVKEFPYPVKMQDKGTNPGLTSQQDAG